MVMSALQSPDEKKWILIQVIVILVGQSTFLAVEIINSQQVIWVLWILSLGELQKRVGNSGCTAWTSPPPHGRQSLG